MECPACGTQNRSESNFCTSCGTALARRCDRCGTANGPSANFCANCGAPLAVALTPPPATDPGERRFVSVLFADLVGFTPFTESRDPEEVRAMLTRYFERARHIVERFGGEIDKFIGDAVTAFWGARVALEDDAERAVRAALDLTDAVGGLGEEMGIPGLALRAGVLSGEASVGSGGNTTGLVLGDIVNTASRLQSIARPGSVFVGNSTRALVQSAIRFEDAGLHQLKGKSEPVQAWRAIEIVAERGGRGRTGGLEAPFVGREHELRLLKDQLHAAGHERRARLVSIIGEGGIGKSRLAWELQKYADGLAGSFYWHQGRSPAYGDGVTFWALGEMVRQRAGVAETDDPLRSRTKLLAAIDEYCSGDQRWIAPRMLGLLGLDDMPEGDRGDLFGALRAFFHRIAERGTAVLVFEDLHWADEGLLEFVVDLVERSPRHPLLVITLARPSLLDRRPDWGAARPGFTSLHLGPLADADMTALVTEAAPGIEPDTVELVVSAAGGVPLYAIEYVRMLVASGDLVRDGDGYRQLGSVDTLALPDSLQAVVGARLDRFSPTERAVIQDAAVLGHSFTLAGLAAISDLAEADLRPLLDRLIRGEVLRLDEDPRSPERGQYGFVQSMIREVAYGRLSKADRKLRHLRVARQLQDLDAGEFAAVVADHYVSALEAGPDPEVAAAARHALLAAARRAAELHSHAQTLAIVEQALAIPGEDAAPLWELGARAASSLFAHDKAIAMGRQALESQEAHGDENGRVASAAVLGYALTGAESPGQAVEVMSRYFVAGRAGEPAMMRLGAELARAYMLFDQGQQAADVARDTMMAAEAAGNVEIVVETLNSRGSALGPLGRLHEALALLREAIRLADEHGLPMAEARALNNFIVYNSANGLLANRGLTERFMAVAERTSALEYLIRAARFRGDELTVAGRFEEAIEVFEGVDIAADNRWATVFRVETLLVRWALDAGSRHLEEAARLAAGLQGGEEPQLESYYVNLQAKCAFLAGDCARAHVLAVEAPAEGRLPFLDLWSIPVLAAIRLGDRALLDSGWNRAAVPVGRRFEPMARVVEAAIAHRDGRFEEGLTLFLSAIAATETVDGSLPAMILRSLLASLMPEHPEARAAALQAHEWFASTGAAGYLHMFEDVWPIVAEGAGVG